MASQSFRAGVAAILFPKDSSIALPNCTGMAGPSASAIALDDSYYSSIKQPLPTATNLQFRVALMGRNTIIYGNGGYSVTPASPATGILQLTGTQAAEIIVPLGNWPSNFQYAAAVVVYIKIGSRDWQIAGFRQIVDDIDFTTTITRKPTSSVTFSDVILTTFDTSTKELGDRRPLGYTYDELAPTTEDVLITYDTEAIQFSPNNTIDWSGATARSVGVQFQLLNNVLKSLIQSTAGDFDQFTDVNGNVIKEAEQAIYTAQFVAAGNRPLRLVFPINPDGSQETLLLLGLFLTNQKQVQFALSKKKQAPVNFVFEPAGLDAVLNNQATAISRAI